MHRDDLFALIGSALLAGVAWYDREWRWFWAAAAGLMFVWTLATAVRRWW